MRKPWVAFTDGGCHPNPEGVMGIGVVLDDPEGHRVAELSERPPKKGTNNEAEFIAVLRALQTAADRGARELEVRLDSKLVANVLSGRWRLKAENLLPLRDAIEAERRGFAEVRFRWIPRARNKDADRLATEAAGGDPTGRTRYGADDDASTPRIQAAAVRPKAEEVGVLCSGCKQACTFRWQRFKDGSWHIRQECPTHGFLRYTPKGHPWEELAGERA